MEASSRVGVKADRGALALWGRPSDPRKEGMCTTNKSIFYTVGVCAFPAHVNDELLYYIAFSIAIFAFEGSFFSAVFSAPRGVTR